MITKRTYVLAALTATLFAAGCGHKSKKDDSAAPPPAATATPGPTDTPNGTPTPTPVTALNSLETLQACFKIDAAQVQPIVAADEATAKTQADGICGALAKANYAAGVSLTALPADSI